MAGLGKCCVYKYTTLIDLTGHYIWQIGSETPGQRESCEGFEPQRLEEV
jgi:hypothetical protein